MSGWTNGRPTNSPTPSAGSSSLSSHAPSAPSHGYIAPTGGTTPAPLMLGSSTVGRAGGVNSVDPFSERFADDTSTFDTLADLFLGEFTAGREAESQSGPRSVAAGITANGSILSGVRGTSAVRLADAQPSSQRARPGVELLILGHLPALASIWGTQYLRDSVRTLGAPIGSLRLQAGFASVEIFPESGAPVALGAATTLDQAIASASRMVGRWVIRTDASDELEFVDGEIVETITLLTGADEAATIGAYRTIKQLAARFEEVSPTPAPNLRVVVMGTDAAQASAVGEKLAATARQCLGREVACRTASAKIGSVRPAHLVYNGHADGRPSQVLHTLDHALNTMMNERAAASVAVTNLPTPPAAPVTLQSSPSPSLKADDSIFGDMPATASSKPARASTGTPLFEEILPKGRASSPSMPTPPMHSIDLDPDELPIRVKFETPKQRSAERAAELAASVPAAMDEPSSLMPLGLRTPVVPSPRMALRPEPMIERIEAEPAAQFAKEHRDEVQALAHHLTGLATLNLTCPYAPDVEFALDASGRLQVLARFDRRHLDESSLGVLLIAAEWALAHGTLLRAAAPSLTGRADATINTDHKPVMHVFTAEPKRVRRLLETDVRVHLLSPVNVDGRAGWFCTALN